MRTYFGFLVMVMGVLPMLAQTPASKDLRLFYQQNCVRCHGLDGAGIDPTGKKIRGQDLTDAAWAKATTDEAMVKAILNGKFFGRAMPAYKKDLTPDEALRM
ncbi:MAG: cytochrome c, partial [Holophaga sp.]|nr:cytochrome c [Holophaga sp.]